MIRKYSNFGLGVAIVIGPLVLQVAIWALAVPFNRSLPLWPLLLAATPLQALVVWAVWRSRHDFVRIIYDPSRRRIGVRRILPVHTFYCAVDELTIEDESGSVEFEVATDEETHVHRICAGENTVLTCRCFTQKRIKSMLKEWHLSPDEG